MVFQLAMLSEGGYSAESLKQLPLPELYLNHEWLVEFMKQKYGKT